MFTSMQFYYTCRLGDNHHHQDADQFYHKNPLYSNSQCSPLISKVWVTIRLLVISSKLQKWDTQYTWLSSLNILFEIHISFCVSVIHIFSLPCNIPQCKSTTIYSSVKGYLMNQFRAVPNDNTTVKVCSGFTANRKSPSLG
jgi:hypothetical protein